MRIPWSSARRVTILLLGAVSSLAARPLEVTSFPPEWPHEIPYRLNRELLLPGESERIVFVVDVVRGFQPKTEALDHLVALASRHAERPASWLFAEDEAAPDVTWVRGEDRRPLHSTRISRDMLETLDFLGEIPHCAGGALPADTSFVFVRYVGTLGSVYGSASSTRGTEGCGERTLPLIYLAQDRVARDRAPTFTRRYLATRALAHEYGHVLGLASNPAHGWWGSTISYRGGAHCTHRECAVAVPTAKALIAGQMLDYCDACLRDIEQARLHWRTGKRFPAVPRLPQRDPRADVRRLKKYNFRPDGKAEKLLGYGKLVVPALIERLPKLPGERPGSPRQFAASLILRIVASEHRERSGERILLRGSSSAVLRWWSREGPAFLAGDDWELP